MYANSYRQHPFGDYSNKKQGRAKVKVEETDPARSQILFFPVTTSFQQFICGLYCHLEAVISI